MEKKKLLTDMTQGLDIDEQEPVRQTEGTAAFNPGGSRDISGITRRPNTHKTSQTLEQNKKKQLQMQIKW